MRLHIGGVLEVETFGFRACYIRCFSHELWIERLEAEEKEQPPRHWLEAITGLAVKHHKY